MMDAVELPSSVDVAAPPKLIVSEGLVQTGAAVNAVDGPGSNPLSIIAGHSIECRSSRHDGIGESLIDYTWLSSKSCKLFFKVRSLCLCFPLPPPLFFKCFSYID